MSSVQARSQRRFHPITVRPPKSRVYQTRRAIANAGRRVIGSLGHTNGRGRAATPPGPGGTSRSLADLERLEERLDVLLVAGRDRHDVQLVELRTGDVDP